MRQVLHIFRKDLRHFWPEALSAILILIVFAAIYPVQWKPQGAVLLVDGRRLDLQGLAGVLTALVPIAWFLLIVRLFHDENPVSQRLPAGANPIPIDISLSATHDRHPSIRNVDDKHLTLILPLDIAGIPYGFTVEPNDVQLRITAADGTHWTSPWHSIDNRSYTSQTEEATVSVTVDRAFLMRARKRPVALDLDLALTQSEAGQSQVFRLPPSGSLTIPGFGLCDVEDVPATYQPNLHCRYALSPPRRTLLTAFVTTQPCSESGSAPARSFPETVATGSYQPDPAEFGITSVWEPQLGFTYTGSADEPVSPGPRARLCPGTSVSLTPYQVVRRSRYRVERSGVQFPE